MSQKTLQFAGLALGTKQGISFDGVRQCASAELARCWCALPESISTSTVRERPASWTTPFSYRVTFQGET